ncbi:MAG TPA: YfiR family protein [Caulobacteraceae bacterium]|nr:YfiR family protein [Caulobacteraceae bacterium]
MALARPITILLAALAVACSAAPVRAQTSLETEVKATFLYKFAPFVEWPASAFEGPTSPLWICIFGPDPFGPVLDRAVAGQTAGGRPIQLRRSGSGDKVGSCQILYASGSPAAVSKVLKAAHGQPVLTVTDGGQPAGIIDFILNQGRVRFRIDDAEAAQSNLAISSKLLSLALGVKPRKPPGGAP